MDGGVNTSFFGKTLQNGSVKHGEALSSRRGEKRLCMKTWVWPTFSEIAHSGRSILPTGSVSIEKLQAVQIKKAKPLTGKRNAQKDQRTLKSLTMAAR